MYKIFNECIDYDRQWTNLGKKTFCTGFDDSSVTYNALFNLCICLFVAYRTSRDWFTHVETHTVKDNTRHLHTTIEQYVLVHLFHGFDGEQSTCCPKVRGEALGNCGPRPKGQLMDCSPINHGISVLLPNLLYNFYKNTCKLFATLKFGECCLTQRCFKQATVHSVTGFMKQNPGNS